MLLHYIHRYQWCGAVWVCVFVAFVSGIFCFSLCRYSTRRPFRLRTDETRNGTHQKKNNCKTFFSCRFSVFCLCSAIKSEKRRVLFWLQKLGERKETQTLPLSAIASRLTSASVMKYRVLGFWKPKKMNHSLLVVTAQLTYFFGFHVFVLLF